MNIVECQAMCQFNSPLILGKMKIYIKNMVCDRCIAVVSNIFREAGFPVKDVQLGNISVETAIPTEQLKLVEEKLKNSGFEIISDAKSRLIDQIKNLIIDLIYKHPEKMRVNYSDYLSDQINLDYSYLSTFFSSVEGVTIEKYIIRLKTERVKELIVYDEKTLSEIAFEMGYSSVAHLSGQFKKVTGFTPSYYKSLGKRKSIDSI
jgi:AraC-like DNA-binding protein